MAITIIRKTPPAVEVALVLPTHNLPPAKAPTAPPAAPLTPPAHTPSPGTESILEALSAYSVGSKKKVLMLVHKTTGNAWKVLHYDPTTSRTRLQNSAGLTILPILSQRENEIYYPLWR